jgi:hypothetical protein
VSAGSITCLYFSIPFEFFLCVGIYMCVRAFVILLTFFQLYRVHIRISRTRIMKIKIKNKKHIKWNWYFPQFPCLDISWHCRDSYITTWWYYQQTSPIYSWPPIDWYYPLILSYIDTNSWHWQYIDTTLWYCHILILIADTAHILILPVGTDHEWCWLI